MRSPLLLVSILLVGVGAITVYPLIALIFRSLFLEGQFTLEAYAKILSDPWNFKVLANSLFLGLTAGTLSTLLGTILAWLVVRTDMPFKRPIEAIATVPYVTLPIFVALAYLFLLGPRQGFINQLFMQITGLDVPLFNVFSWPGLIMVMSLWLYPFTYLIVAASLRNMDASLEDAARMLGAGVMKTFRTVTMPLVMPSIMAGWLLAFTISIEMFGIPGVIGSLGGIFVFSTAIYRALQLFPPDFASATSLSTVLLAFTMVCIFLQSRILAKGGYTTVSGRAEPPRPISLGKWKYLALTYCFLLILMAVILPYAAVGLVAFSDRFGVYSLDNLTLRHFITVLFELDVTVRGLRNSVILASSAATVAIIISAIISYVSVKTDWKGRKSLDYVARTPLAMPGTVLAVGLMWTYARDPFYLHGTLWILLLAYIIRYMPYSIGATTSALLQIDASLEEAARIQGGSWFKTFRTVVLPLMLPALLSGWLLVFIPSMRELPASVLLSASGTETASVAVYDFFEQGGYRFGAASALMIIMLLIVGLATLINKWLEPKRLKARAA